MRERLNQYSFVAGYSTRILSSKPGRLERIIINQISGGNGVEIRDSTSTAGGTRILNIQVTANDSVRSIEIGCDFGSGLTIITSGAVMNVTVVFYEYEQEKN